MLYGPNTNLSHVSVMLMIEAQARYISAMFRAVQEAERVGGRSLQQYTASAAKEHGVRKVWMRKLVQGKGWRCDQQLAGHRSSILEIPIGSELGRL